MFTRGGLVIVITLLVAGCDVPPPPDYVAQDSARCEAAGFAPGSAELAQCMRTAATERQSDADRQAWQAEQQRRASAAEDARREVDWQASVDAMNQRSEDFQREAAQRSADFDAMVAGGGAPEEDAAWNPPTASGIPGMTCDGVGVDAACDAR